MPWPSSAQWCCYWALDRFMSEARSITNTIGNAVGTLAIAQWVGALDRERLERVLNGESTAAEIQALYEHPEEEEQAPAPASLAMVQKASA